MLIALNKPFGVLCQFTTPKERPTLADYVQVANVYAAGRLDFDSEGLILLTDEGRLQHAIASPSSRLSKRYWAQVEGRPDAHALARLSEGVRLPDGISQTVEVPRIIEEPVILWPRNPPIRARLRIPTTWLELVFSEGRNRQVRRSTAAVGHPTLRLIRFAIGPIDLVSLGLAPGQWRNIDAKDLQMGSDGSTPRAARDDFRFARQPSRGSRR